ncbi:hypothetical protein INR49_017790, partial [Caranx melampygus]
MVQNGVMLMCVSTYRYLDEVRRVFVYREKLRFRKLRFLPADKVIKVQNTVRAMALAAKQQVRQPTASNHGASSTAQDSPPDVKRATIFLDSDSST